MGRLRRYRSNIYTTTAGNGAAGNSQNQIQEIVWTRTKVGANQSIADSFKASEIAWRQPGRAQMMGGFLDFMGFGDIIGTYIENNVSSEDQRTGALGLFAVAIALKKPGLIAKEIGAVEKEILSTEVNVVRGGTCLACQFENGPGVTVDIKGLLNGVSVNNTKGLSIKDLSVGIPNGKIGTTTIGQIEALGGKITSSPTKNNPFHSTLSGITAAQAEKLFNPTIKNPLK